jgi:hypothetical protein
MKIKCLPQVASLDWQAAKLLAKKRQAATANDCNGNSKEKGKALLQHKTPLRTPW